MDSVILAFILAAFGIAIFAWRRYREMLLASSAREKAEQKVRMMAYHDPLTGLPNRAALRDNLKLLASGPGKRQIALIYLDLDRFKWVNDMHGHLAADRLLRQVAQRLAHNKSADYTAYRLDGDEFAVVMDITGLDRAHAEDTARRIVRMMTEPFEDQRLVHYIGATAGLAHFPAHAEDHLGLMRAADVALNRAREAGRNQCRCYEAAMDEHIKARAALEVDLRTAVACKQIVPFYQPLVDLETGALIGVELLARWPREDGYDIGPDQFIPIAEECGLITDLMLCLIDQACEDTRKWRSDLTIAINISPVQFQDPWLSHKILAALTRNGFAPQRFAIEITENAIISDEPNATRSIESFKNQGMKIGLDDFGTGYASMHHLRLLPFDKIKIDRTFITDIDHDADKLKMAKAMIGLAHHLDLPVIAEGIETASVADILRGLGCAVGQGYYFSKAVPADQMTDLITRNGTAWTAATRSAAPAATPSPRPAAEAELHSRRALRS
ncbi:EAL domain-containing protein [Sphingobium sp. DEHP117]|uniref:putative bifunctional diguanylate cyclase/phosphodiesterase n=1 Tax=Sphingobium sp. DEHP117 TaxID=2993436 RepID=UPI0027D5B799|nr:EAL domain-containing protein [Sphingobium sp. DEHP117]MDQ4419964.1 EAL domain-containing protein [Sphingobium sp. DEHP117]